MDLAWLPVVVTLAIVGGLFGLAVAGRAIARHRRDRDVLTEAWRSKHP